MDKVKKKLLKEALSKVNATLKYYEAEWISAQRTPYVEREKVVSFEHYVEIRVNLEISRIPELHDLVCKTDGHLFICTSLDDVNDLRHRFKRAHISFNDPENFPEEVQDEIRGIIEEAKTWLGGGKFTFNSVVERVKIVIEE